jgi:hypothetical protein
MEQGPEDQTKIGFKWELRQSGTLPDDAARLLLQCLTRLHHDQVGRSILTKSSKECANKLLRSANATASGERTP